MKQSSTRIFEINKSGKRSIASYLLCDLVKYSRIKSILPNMESFVTLIICSFTAGFISCAILKMTIFSIDSRENARKEITVNIKNRPDDDEVVIESVLQYLKISKSNPFFYNDYDMKSPIAAIHESKEENQSKSPKNRYLEPDIELRNGFLSINLEAASSHDLLADAPLETKGIPEELTESSSSGSSSSRPIAEVETASLPPLEKLRRVEDERPNKSTNSSDDRRVQTITPKMKELLQEFKILSESGGFRVVVPGTGLFVGNSKNLASNASRILKPIAEVAKIIDGFTLKVVGHTDGIKNVDQSMSLSLHRAGLVKALLSDMLKNEPVRLEADGKGKEVPIASNATLDGRQANRRIEILFVKQI